MEKLIQQLIEKHKLSQTEALDAINLVAEYLKEQYPNLQGLIDDAITGQDGNPSEDGLGK